MTGLSPAAKILYRNQFRGRVIKKLIFWTFVWFLSPNFSIRPPEISLVNTTQQWAIAYYGISLEAERLFFFKNDIVLHFVDNQQMGLKPMLLYLPAVLSGQMLTVMFHTPLLPHYSLITLLLEVLIHIWMLTYVFREINNFYWCVWIEKNKGKKSFVCFVFWSLFWFIIRIPRLVFLFIQTVRI